MTVTAPSNINFGTVVWRAVSDITDREDVGADPDFIAPTGTVTFVASVSNLRDNTATPAPVTIIRDTITGVLDSEGYLCTALDDGTAGARGVKLIATDDPDLNPTAWAYNVTYSLKGANQRSLTMTAHQIYVVTGEVVDLTLVGPVANATAIGVAQAEALAAIAAQAAVEAAASLADLDPATAALVTTPSATRTALDGKYATIAAADGKFANNSARYFVRGSNSLPKWRKAMARVRTGQGSAKILCIGDSTTAGTAPPLTSATAHNRAYPTWLAGILNASIPASRGLSIPAANGSSDTNDLWTLGTGWAKNGQGFATNSSYLAGSGATGALVFAEPAVNANRFDVYYVTSAGGGTIAVTATGSSAVTQSCNAAIGIGKITVSAAAAATTNTVSITNTIGNSWIVGIEPWLSTSPNLVRVANAGEGGSKLVGFWNLAGASGTAGMLTAYAPDLTIISLGINDSTISTTEVAYRAAMTTLLGYVSAAGSDVIVLPPVFQNATTFPTPAALQAQYAAGLKARGIPYFDLNERNGGFAGANAAGFMCADATHMEAIGYADLAQFIASGLVAT